MQRVLLIALCLSLALTNPGEDCSLEDICDHLEFCNDNGVCEHKEVWPPNWLELIGIGLVSFFSMLSAACGIGGSEITIPLIETFFGFEQGDAVPIAQIMILAVCTTRFLMRFTERHPLKANATEVDYTAVSVLLPNIILGASLGILINTILPVLFVSIILVLLILAAAGKSLYKAI